MENNNLYRAISKDGSVVIAACDSTDIVGRAAKIHRTSLTATAALGRALTAASLMGSMLKNEGNTLTLQFKCDGPCGNICCVSDYKGNVRGYIDSPSAELAPNSLGKLDVGGAVGKGTLCVVRDLGFDEPTVGMCEVESGEIAEDITAYFAKSEQVPTACALGVLVDKDFCVNCAGGFIVQLLPFADEGIITTLENNLKNVSSVSHMIKEGKTPIDIIDTVFSGIEYDMLDKTHTEFKCNCSRKRYEKIMISLGKEELERLKSEDEQVETVCSFCGEKYIFSKQDLERFIGEATR